MIHHVSIPARDPQHVAGGLAELMKSDEIVLRAPHETSGVSLEWEIHRVSRPAAGGEL